MAQEQTAYVGDDIKVLVNVIDSSGSHVAAVINTSTTRLNGLSTVPTVTTIATGIYQIVFSGVTPAPSEGDRLVAKINGSISGTAWTEYGIPVVVVADERGTENAAPSRHYTFADSSGTDYVDVYTDFDVAKNLPKVQKAIVRLKLTGNAASSSDWRLKLHVPSGNPASGFDLLDGVTLPASVSNYIFQAEVDITACDNVDGIWSIVFEDFNAYGSVLSINDAAVEFSDVPVEIGDATTANQTAISNAIAALNDPTATETAGEVWDSLLSAHNVAGSFGKAVRQLKEGVISQDGQVSDPSATSTSFVTNLSESTDGFYHDKVIVLVSGNLAGQARHIEDYNGTTKGITVSQAFTSAVPNGSEFLILATHEHSLAEIATETWNQLTSTSWASGSFGERVLVGLTTDRLVEVNASSHVSADVHAMQNDVITSSVIDATAVTELQTGLVTVGTQFTYTNQAGDTHNVTIS